MGDRRPRSPHSPQHPRATTLPRLQRRGLDLRRNHRPTHPRQMQTPQQENRMNIAISAASVIPDLVRSHPVSIDVTDDELLGTGGVAPHVRPASSGTPCTTGHGSRGSRGHGRGRGRPAGRSETSDRQVAPHSVSGAAAETPGMSGTDSERSRAGHSYRCPVHLEQSVTWRGSGCRRCATDRREFEARRAERRQAARLRKLGCFDGE